ncbi:MAG: hypothetical protein IJ739_01335 [Bacteroidaceae bacterium]|nr:hypothetical protein [Bacteroidaceae bacterium]
MNKKAYIIPAVNVMTLNIENMIATSGPGTSSDSANQEQGMDTKSSDWNIWDE